MPPIASVENNFTRGFISQATGMNFPENACTATQNCVFRPWGLVERRLGFDVETGGQSQFTGIANLAFTQYVWKDVTGNGNINLAVIQIGPTVYFYNLATVSPSSQ